MAKVPEVQDEYGETWLVYPGDPASRLVGKLAKVAQYIVLPQETLMTGQVVEVTPPEFNDSLDISNEYVRLLVLRRHRLYDCVRHLQEGK